ncbi:MAG: alpha/beta hydrolase [Verrucomicrobia bacterium]|nr:alpha/beta hydrolase [Prolixibacteraceae bacterium]
MSISIPLTIQGQGEPVIWLHGMLNSVESDSLYSLINLHKLSESVQVIRYDACGKSISGDYKWDSMTNQLADVMEANTIDQAVVAGTSMGSVTALHFAVRHPEKVKALILVTPPPAWEKREAVKSVYRKIASKASHGQIPDFLKRLISLTQDPPEFYEQQYPGTRQKLMDYRLAFDPHYYPQIYNGGAASDLPSREQLAEIKVPTFIAALPDDENHPLDIAKEINALINNSIIEVVSDYNDYLNLQENVKQFLRDAGCNNKL